MASVNKLADDIPAPSSLATLTSPSADDAVCLMGRFYDVKVVYMQGIIGVTATERTANERSALRPVWPHPLLRESI